MRILMVGGSGYVGSLMLPGLAARHEIRVLDPVAPPGGDGHEPGYEPGYEPGHAPEHVAGSALDAAALAVALDGVDAVVHAAMGRRSDVDWPHPDLVRSFEVNVASVYATLAAAHEAGVDRVVLISSLSVFADAPVPLTDRSIDETSEPDAADLYGVTKRLAEQVARIAADTHGMTVTALRLAWPTPDDVWPRWALPEVFADPVQITRADGAPYPALAASDLVTAVDAALSRTGGYDVFHILGDDGSGRCLSTAKARDQLGWVARHR
ncbi:NAD(P)-dependent oxidoreductase [Catenulispora subtropica]|uniref:NAD-dependent glucose-6-phosphate dehydrogenase Azf n=1 Tax=Catenulispora subtropica TaxID=450798 RepID=A0ABN2T6I0_9ACTN